MAADGGEMDDYEGQLRTNLYDYYYTQLGLADYELRIARRLRGQQGSTLVEKLATRVNLEGADILEVGSGWGENTIELARRGASATGLEPDPALLRISPRLERKKATGARFVKGKGESLPFEDASFDVLVSYTVLEHVQDVQACVTEFARVLRPGGLAYVYVPNYLWPKEPHYRIAFPPLIPKWAARTYLRARKRPPHFINHINYVTPWRMQRALANARLSSESLVYGNARRRGTLSPRRLVADALYRAHLYQGIELFVWHAGASRPARLCATI